MGEVSEASPMEFEQQLQQQEQGDEQPSDEAQQQTMDTSEQQPLPPDMQPERGSSMPPTAQQERGQSAPPGPMQQAAPEEPAAGRSEPAGAGAAVAMPAAQAAAQAAPPGLGSSQAAPAAIEPAPPRSKKRGLGGSSARRSGSEPRDLVHLSGPIPAERLQASWRPVRLSEDEKAAQIVLDDTRLSASSTKGYRTVRATHGRHEGTWYYEVHIEQLGATGAARIGWSTGRGEVQAPVGYDVWSYGYRSLEGSKVHAGWRHEYGEAFQEGDVIGCLIHLPPGGQTWEKSLEEVVKHKGKAYYADNEEEEKEPDPDTPSLKGAFVAFTRNGKLQGKAFEDIREGTYYPAISLYTNARTFDEARVRCNFGEAPFAHPPPQPEGCPEPKPAAEMAGPRPEGWSEEREREAAQEA